MIIFYFGTNIKFIKRFFLIKTVVDELEQIKPDKSLDHEKWEPGTKWLVVIMFDNTFELLMTDDLGTSYSIK